MNSTTFYIEYLINGSVALIWIYLGFADEIPNDIAISFSAGVGAFALVPIAYVLGIVVEAVGAVIFETPLRKLLSDKDDAKANDSLNAGDNGKPSETAKSSRTVSIFKANRDVGLQLHLRRSRDRIVRGAIVNLALIWTFYSVTLSTNWKVHTLLGVSICVLMAAWIIFHVGTRDFKAAAFRQLKDESE